MLKMSRNLFKVAIKKLTNDLTLGKTHASFSMSTVRISYFFLQKVHNKVIRKQCKLAGIYSRSCTHPRQPKMCYSLIHTDNLTAKIK